MSDENYFARPNAGLPTKEGFPGWLTDRIQELLNAGERDIGCSNIIEMPIADDSGRMSTISLKPPTHWWRLKETFYQCVAHYCSVDVESELSRQDIKTTHNLRLAMRIVLQDFQDFQDESGGKSVASIDEELQATDPKAKSFQDENGQWVHRGWLKEHTYSPQRVSDKCRRRWITRETAGQEKGHKKVSVWHYGDVVKTGMDG